MKKNKWVNICLDPIFYVQFQYKSLAWTNAGQKKALKYIALYRNLKPSGKH